MSQYPQQPYQQPPQYPIGYQSYQIAPRDPRAPAKRSAIMLWVLGGLMLLMGACIASLGAVLPSIQNQPELTQAVIKLESQLGMSAATLFLIVGIATIVVAFLYIILGFFTRGGGLGAVICSIVLVSLVTLYVLLSIAGSLLSAGSGGVPGACIWLVVAAVHIITLVWLIQAARASSQIKLAQAQYQLQYWQYQQAQQAYGYPQPGGYGYPQQPQQQQQPQPSPPPPASGGSDGPPTEG